MTCKGGYFWVSNRRDATLLEMMACVLSRSSMYLGKADIRLVEALVHGWSWGRNRQDENHFIHQFYGWARKKRKLKESYSPIAAGWAAMYFKIASEALSLSRGPMSPEALAIEIMRVDWKEYLEVVPADELPYEPEKAAKIKPYRSIDDVAPPERKLKRTEIPHERIPHEDE